MYIEGTFTTSTPTLLANMRINVKWLQKSGAPWNDKCIAQCDHETQLRENFALLRSVILV